MFKKIKHYLKTKSGGELLSQHEIASLKIIFNKIQINYHIRIPII